MRVWTQAQIDYLTKPFPFLMTLAARSQSDTQTITPYVYMYMQIFGGGNTVTERNSGLGAAIGVLLSLCVVLIFTVCNKFIKDDDLEF